MLQWSLWQNWPFLIKYCICSFSIWHRNGLKMQWCYWLHYCKLQDAHLHETGYSVLSLALTQTKLACFWMSLILFKLSHASVLSLLMWLLSLFFFFSFPSILHDDGCPFPANFFPVESHCCQQCGLTWLVSYPIIMMIPKQTWHRKQRAPSVTEKTCSLQCKNRDVFNCKV